MALRRRRRRRRGRGRAVRGARRRPAAAARSCRGRRAEQRGAARDERSPQRGRRVLAPLRAAGGRRRARPGTWRDLLGVHRCGCSTWSHADRARCCGFADLYREARFSDHPLTGERPARRPLDDPGPDPRRPARPGRPARCPAARRWWCAARRLGASRRHRAGGCALRCSIHGPARPSCGWPCSCSLPSPCPGWCVDAWRRRPARWTGRPRAAGDRAARRRPPAGAYVRMLEAHLSARTPTRRCATGCRRWPTSAARTPRPRPPTTRAPDALLGSASCCRPS